ncbi:MAG: hypothetical protein AAF191_04845 [Verrucomicrobiota bacterium]
MVGGQRIVMLWAGVVLGGSLLAGPAKFMVEDLTMPVALQVGRAQFLWVACGELLCVLLALLVGIWGWERSARKSGWVLACGFFLVAGSILVFQHLVLMAPLQVRSERIMAGEAVGKSSLHLIYVALEGIKFLCILVAGGWPISQRQGG